MKSYKVIAKDDYFQHPHSWKKGLDYEWVDKEDYFTIASDQGSLNYHNDLKPKLSELFETVEQEN